MNRSNLIKSACIIYAGMTGICFADDIDALKQTVANRICPRPAMTYSPINFEDVCGKHDIVNFTHEQSVAWGQCFDKVSDDNKQIYEYNDFIRKNCMKNSAGGDQTRSSSKVKSSGASAGQNTRDGSSGSAPKKDLAGAFSALGNNVKKADEARSQSSNKPNETKQTYFISCLRTLQETS